VQFSVRCFCALPEAFSIDLPPATVLPKGEARLRRTHHGNSGEINVHFYQEYWGCAAGRRGIDGER
jgi:hypothetical protein